MLHVNGLNSPKIKTESELVEIMAGYRVANKTVGLCVGCFDLLHPGHMVHFISGKKRCDKLVVGVTCDAYVKVRKGDKRPIYDENVRAFSISCLESVDAVLVSPYKTAVELIKNLKPNYYIKGPDYKDSTEPAQIDEREAIKSVGGEVIYTQDDTLSTTQIIKHIATLDSQIE